MSVIATRSFNGFRLREKTLLPVVFFVYVVLLSFTVYHHEPWMDEAQAWLLVKDVSLGDLLVKYLRYEGSPGLWHLILMLPAKLGLPYFSINITSAFFSALGVWLFMRYSPFSLAAKCLYPFGFFIFFQYGVVARSYCLIAPLLFLVAMVYPKKLEKPYWFLLLLCLLANVSAHTFLIAGSIALLHALDVWKLWKNLDSRQRLQQLVSGALFGLVALAVVLIIRTPPDQIYAGSINLDYPNFVATTKFMVGGSLVADEFSHFPWISGLISCYVFYLSVVWLVEQKTWQLYLLPLALLCLLFALKYRSLWHEGVLFELWLFVLWISFRQQPEVDEQPRLTKHIKASVVLVLFVQAYWCMWSMGYDWRHNYSASRDLSKYIKLKHYDRKKIYASGWRIISALPYFDKNIFYNHNYGSKNRFWNWSKYNVTSVGASIDVLDTIECENPEMVLFASDHIPSRKKIALSGYKPTAFFTGYLCWKTGLIEPECYLLFTRRPKTKVKPAQPTHTTGL